MGASNACADHDEETPRAISWQKTPQSPARRTSPGPPIFISILCGCGAPRRVSACLRPEGSLDTSPCHPLRHQPRPHQRRATSRHPRSRPRCDFYALGEAVGGGILAVLVEEGRLSREAAPHCSNVVRAFAELILSLFYSVRKTLSRAIVFE